MPGGGANDAGGTAAGGTAGAQCGGPKPGGALHSRPVTGGGGKETEEGKGACMGNALNIAGGAPLGKNA